jgi:anti-sigma factor RsiW
MTENLNRNLPPELSDDDAELLSAYLDDMLTTAERETLEARLAVDVFLRAELAAMRQTVDWLNHMPALQAPRNFTISAEAVTQDPPPNVVLMPRRNLWLSAAAAVLVVALFGVVFIAGNMMNAEQAPAAEVLRTSDETVVQGADGSAQIAFASTDMPTGTSTPQQQTFIIAATAGFIGTPLAPQTMSMPTATEQLADIALAAEAADTVAEEAESDDFDAATGATMADEAQAAESGLAQANSVETIVIEATQTAVILAQPATQGFTPRMMTVTPMPAATAAPTQSPTDSQAIELANVQMTATCCTIMLTTPTLDAGMDSETMAAGGAPADVSSMQMTATTLQQSQATGGQPIPPTGTDAIALKQEDISLSVRRVVFYILLRYIEFVRTAP